MLHLTWNPYLQKSLSKWEAFNSNEYYSLKKQTLCSAVYSEQYCQYNFTCRIRRPVRLSLFETFLYTLYSARDHSLGHALPLTLFNKCRLHFRHATSTPPFFPSLRRANVIQPSWMGPYFVFSTDCCTASSSLQRCVMQSLLKKFCIKWANLATSTVHGSQSQIFLIIIYCPCTCNIQREPKYTYCPLTKNVCIILFIVFSGPKNLLQFLSCFISASCATEKADLTGRISSLIHVWRLAISILHVSRK